MVVFPNAKINLGLFVTSKRNDGFHNLESVFYPIPLNDSLEINIKKGSGEIKFQSFGKPIPGEIKDNLVVKAIEQFGKKDFNYSVNLLKNIPMGGGLGGGSSNAAFTLKLLKSLNAVDEDDLFDAGMTLGSDCGFFIENKPAFVQGRGEVLKPIDLNLDGYGLKLVLPGLHISTKLAFSKVVPKVNSWNLESLAIKDIYNWKDFLKNDFEVSVFNEFPSLKSIKQELYDSGATYAAMSGTGSTFYGIYSNNKIPKEVTNFKEIDLVL